MRVVSASSIAYRGGETRPVQTFGWLQAGFFGFAYRLAHLSLPRPLVMAALTVFFYIG